MGKWLHRLTDVDITNRVARCNVCGLVQIVVHGKTRRCKSIFVSDRRIGKRKRFAKFMVTKRISTMERKILARLLSGLGIIIRGHRKRHPHVISPRERLRNSFSGKVRRAIRSGKLKRLPCEVCGNLVTQAHHADYSTGKALCVNWLCDTHHRYWHKNNSPTYPSGM